MDSSPPHFISRHFVFTLSLYSVIFLGELKNLRTQMTTDNQSAFQINGNAPFLVIPVVMLLVSEVTSVILFWTTILSKYYASLKFLGIFSVVFGPFSLMLVTNDSGKHVLVYWLLGYVILGLLSAYICSGDDDYDKSLNRSSLDSALTHLGLVLVPVGLVVVLFVPLNLDWMVYPLVYTSMGIQVISFLIIHFEFVSKFMVFEDKQNFHGIQQDKTKSHSESQQDDKNIKDLEANKTIILE